MKTSTLFFLTAVVFAATVGSATGQVITAQQTSAEQTAESPSAIEERAYQLLDDIVAGTQTLKLPENRGRLQIAAADLLWKRDEARARSLFSEAAANVVELARQSRRSTDQPFGEQKSAAQLRQELLLTAARHDGALAYQLFQMTRQQNTELAGSRVPEDESYLEQLLLNAIVATDPDLALQRAEGMLERGEYSVIVVSVLEKLQEQDKRAAARLTDKILARLRPDDLLDNYAAASLALMILRSGPRTSEPQTTAQSASDGYMPGFNLPAYQHLLETMVATALKATPNTSPGLPRVQGNAGAVQSVGSAVVAPDRQRIARDLLLNLRSLLPRIEQYLPARSQAVRQKIHELDKDSPSRTGLDQLTYLTQQGTSNNLFIAAASAPAPAIRDRFYQQAALKALDEGNPDGARQIANDHLDSEMRRVVTNRIAAQQRFRKDKAARVAELQQALTEVTSIHDRVRLLLQLTEATKADNPKHSRQFLDEAYGLVTRPATNYKQLEDQRQVAHVLAEVEPQRSLQVLESGINQLNELLPAAASLSGFEVHIFSLGEMPLPGNSQLGAEVVRYGQELAILAKSDFRSALAAAEQFQYAEARLFARLSILQAVLGRE